MQVDDVTTLTAGQMNVKHEMLAEVRRELKDSKESNLVLSNRVAVLEVLYSLLLLLSHAFSEPASSEPQRGAAPPWAVEEAGGCF